MCSESAEVVLLRGSGIVAMVYSYIILIFQTISPDNKMDEWASVLCRGRPLF